jgi:hypothetical protein
LNALVEIATKAQQTAALVANDLRQLHRLSCHRNPLAEVLAYDALVDAQRLAQHLARIVVAMEADVARRQRNGTRAKGGAR